MSRSVKIGSLAIFTDLGNQLAIAQNEHKEIPQRTALAIASNPLVGRKSGLLKKFFGKFWQVLESFGFVQRYS